MFRIVLTAALSLSLAAQACCQNSGRDTGPSAQPLTLKQVWSLGATYVDRPSGVTFRYPSAWKPGTQFGYHPPSLVHLDGDRAIAGFIYEVGGFPRDRVVGPYSGTNLEGFGLVFATVPAASAAACDSKAASVAESAKHSQVRLGNRPFSAFGTGEAGMSQSISGTLYATWLGHTCYLFETGIAMASPDVMEDVQALTPEQSRFIEKGLLGIMKSVRIAPGG
jgi:hypothetical protein